MHTNEKIDFFACTDFKTMPLMKSAIVECPRCSWRIPVPPEYRDWRAIAETYREAYDKMTDSFFKELKEAGEQFDAPLVEYFDANRQALIAELTMILERLQQQPPAPPPPDAG